MLPPPEQPLKDLTAYASRLRAAGDRRAPSPAVLRMMWFAALQRAWGAGWAAIGRGLGRRPQTCERWMKKFTYYWRRLYWAAEDYAAEVGRQEAAIVLAQAAQRPPGRGPGWGG